MVHTERLYLVIPLLLLLGPLLVSVGVYGALCASGHVPDHRGAKNNVLFGPFWGRYAVWVMTPVERLFAGRVSPNTVTALSLAAGLCACVAVATGHLITGVWAYLGSGALDIVDGRIARALGRQTKSGALFDSVSDRWAELAVMGGYTWYLRETPWMIAALVAAGASVMVSYTRARGEGLGLDLRGGLMQRAERVMLVCAGTYAAAWLGAAPSTHVYVVPVLGATIALCGLASLATALGRWRAAFTALVIEDRAIFAAKAAEQLSVLALPASASAPGLAAGTDKHAAKPARANGATASASGPFAPVPKTLRESAELGI